MESPKVHHGLIRLVSKEVEFHCYEELMIPTQENGTIHWMKNWLHGCSKFMFKVGKAGIYVPFVVRLGSQISVNTAKPECATYL